MTLRILDCTLRDGGYYNGWCFSRELAGDHLAAVARAGVDAVEIGFRRFPASTFLGPHAYSADRFLDTLPIPDGPVLGVMIDAKEILQSGFAPGDAVDRLFSDAKDSRVGLVRVAAHFDEVERCGPIVERLRLLGYTVGLNIMQMAGRPEDRVSELAALVAGWGCVEVLYFADSMGSMGTEDVDRYFAAVRAGWPGEIGIHTHNNKGQAIQNSLHAVEIGVTWIDATMLGMGRGAGNAQLGILLGELRHRGVRDFDLVDVYAVGERHFQPLQDEYRWGSNFFYHFSALNGIHPMFAQTLLADRRYSAEEKFQALVALADVEASKFDPKSIDGLLSPFATASSFEGEEAYEPRDERASGAAGAEALAGERTLPAADLGAFEGETVLIVGAGGSVAKYADDIAFFVDHHEPVVLTMNHQAAIDLDRVDGIVSVDQHRLLCEAEFLADCGKPVYTAERLLPAAARGRLADAALREYDCLLEPGRFEARPDGCVIPVPLAVAYALALCAAAGVKRIFLVGFDGFDPDDPRQDQMLELFRLAEGALADVELIALTPSSYPVPQGSIYADYR